MNLNFVNISQHFDFFSQKFLKCQKLFELYPLLLSEKSCNCKFLSYDYLISLNLILIFIWFYDFDLILFLYLITIWFWYSIACRFVYPSITLKDFCHNLPCSLLQCNYPCHLVIIMFELFLSCRNAVYSKKLKFNFNFARFLMALVTWLRSKDADILGNLLIPFLIFAQSFFGFYIFRSTSKL